MSNTPPASFNDFMSSLEAYNIVEFDEPLAQMLRIQASSKDLGTIMTSGKSVLPYVYWLADGMSMSNKLIVHLDSGDEALNQISLKLMDIDIRITSHCQEQKEFTNDISMHRMDLLLLTKGALPVIEQWLTLLSDTGILVLLATAETRMSLVQKYSDDYFCLDKEYLFISRKGSHHNKKRKRSKRRKALKNS